MTDIDEIRRENILLLEAEAGGPTQMANKVNMSLTQYLNLRDGAKDSGTGKPRGMRKSTAWRFDSAGGKPRGWLDVDHGGNTDSQAHTHKRLLVKRVCAIAETISDFGLKHLLLDAQRRAEEFPLSRKKKGAAVA